MEPKANYALIGAFVIFAAVALMGFALWMGQNQFRESFDEYDIVFEGPVTLDDGASVRYIGIKVGEVRWVRIDRSDPSKVRARIRIDSETPVKTDSTANIDFAGITGVTFIQINAGTVGAANLARRAGEPVPLIPEAETQLSQLLNSGANILAEANVTADQIQKLLSDQNIEYVSSTLANLDLITARLAAEDGLIDKANATLVSIRATSDRYGELVDTLEKLGEDADTAIQQIGADVSAITADASVAMVSVTDASLETERAATLVADALEGQIEGVVTDVRLATQDLRRLLARSDAFVRRLDANPQSVVQGDALPYEEN
ncbi:MAG: MlaD family protein [Pseudomonadota bacterium]